VFEFSRAASAAAAATETVAARASSTWLGTCYSILTCFLVMLPNRSRYIAFYTVKINFVLHLLYL